MGQLSTGIMQPGFDRAFGDVQRVRRILQAHIEFVDHVEDFAFVARQPGQGAKNFGIFSRGQRGQRLRGILIRLS